VGEPIARLREELVTLERAWSRGHHGRWAARRRADLVDAALAELYARAGAPPGTALVAVGGYGRRQMLPRSDVDLLIVHDDGADPAALADVVLYPLWDAGFEVGHAVRTPEECAQTAVDLDALTAMLDMRLVAGEAAPTERARTAVHEAVVRDPVGFVRRLREDRARRADRLGSAAHLLEPDVKQGLGALRDVHQLRWLSAVLGRPLADAGLVRPLELEAVDAAEEFLVRVRSAIHLETGRRADRLVADLQPGIARAMGFTDEPRLIAMDGLMRGLFAHARHVDHVVTLVLDRTEAGGHEGVSPLAGAGDVLHALADVAEGEGVASPELLDAIEAADVPDPSPWDASVLDGFLRILRAGERGARALDTLDRLGLLTRLIPEWVDVRCRPQRDPYHRLTVDAHLTTAVACMAGIALGDGDREDPVEREAAAQVADVDALLLGALLHDIGKTGEGGHVAVGARIGTRILQRMPLRPETRELAAFLVAHHLLIPDTASRRDLADEDLILDVAARVGSPERLAALYLLARADAAATGPTAWTPWRQTLIRELVAKVQRVFERGEMGTELAERLTDRIGRVRELLAGEREDEVDRFVLRMPRGYFLSIEPAQVARHFASIAPAVGVNEVRTTATAGSRPSTYEVLVVAADRPGLLSWIAGALSLGGISILSAQVFTTEDGVAVDVFEVEGLFEPGIDERRWREFRTTLRRTIEGSISLEHRMEDKRRRYPGRTASVPVSVRIDNDASDFYTVIEVGASDRIGLLHEITRSLADLKLDVHLAKVSTYDRRVVDAFYVRDALGRKVMEPDQRGEIERTLQARLSSS
jgi:[protein-PII] uridylyltransferase